jgi:AcrR family transcriptional regulator
MDALLPFRERKKLKTRDKVAVEAMRLFALHGFDGVTVEEIAEAAEISRSTFFRYFPNKEAVVFPYFEERLERFRRLLAEGAKKGRIMDAVGHACMGMVDEYVASRDQLLAQRRVVLGSPALVAHERVIDRGFEQALVEVLRGSWTGPRSLRRARVLAGAVMGAIRATLELWFESEGKADLPALAKKALNWLEVGLGETLIADVADK